MFKKCPSCETKNIAIVTAAMLQRKTGSRDFYRKTDGWLDPDLAESFPKASAFDSFITVENDDNPNIIVCRDCHAWTRIEN
jgi:hypothetical protein